MAMISAVVVVSESRSPRVTLYSRSQVQAVSSSSPLDV